MFQHVAANSQQQPLQPSQRAGPEDLDLEKINSLRRAVLDRAVDDAIGALLGLPPNGNRRLADAVEAPEEEMGVGGNGSDGHDIILSPTSYSIPQIEYTGGTLSADKSFCTFFRLGEDQARYAKVVWHLSLYSRDGKYPHWVLADLKTMLIWTVGAPPRKIDRRLKRFRAGSRGGAVASAPAAPAGADASTGKEADGAVGTVEPPESFCAGCAFVFNPCDVANGSRAFPLERHGAPPFNLSRPRQTELRACIRAMVAALGYRDWWIEGWQRVVVHTNSKTAHRVATAGLGGLAHRGIWASPLESDWLDRNWDLWSLFHRLLERYARHGCEVSVWFTNDCPSPSLLAGRIAKEEALRERFQDEYIHVREAPLGPEDFQEFWIV